MVQDDLVWFGSDRKPGQKQIMITWWFQFVYPLVEDVRNMLTLPKKAG